MLFLKKRISVWLRAAAPRVVGLRAPAALPVGLLVFQHVPQDGRQAPHHRKAYACWQGALTVPRAPWLCFVDADTVSLPQLLAVTLAVIVVGAAMGGLTWWLAAALAQASMDLAAHGPEFLERLFRQVTGHDQLQLLGRTIRAKPFAAEISDAAMQHGGPLLVVGFVAYYIVVRLVIDQVIGPLMLGYAARVHPVATIFSFLAGGVLFGALGLILAVPVAAAVKIVLTTVYDEGATGLGAGPKNNVSS